MSGPVGSLSSFLSPAEEPAPWILAVVLLVGLPALLTPLVVYVVMFRCGGVKRWLRSNRHSLSQHVSAHAHTHTRARGDGPT